MASAIKRLRETSKSVKATAAKKKDQSFDDSLEDIANAISLLEKALTNSFIKECEAGTPKQASACKQMLAATAKLNAAQDRLVGSFSI